MENAGKVIALVGGVLVVLGGVVWAVGRAFPNFRPGRLPGDVVVDRPGFSFFFPITTMIVVSIVLTLVLWLVGLAKR